MQEIHLDEIDISDEINQCWHCKSYNIITKWNSLTTKRLVCTDCWWILQYLHKKVSKRLVSNKDTLIWKSKLSEPINDNNRIDQIIREIQYKKDKNLPLIIYYKDDTASTRTFYDYYVFGKYLKVKWKDHYYTYLLKDIREIL